MSAGETVDKPMGSDWNWLGWGGLASGAGGLWGLATQAAQTATVPFAALTPDSLPPLIAIAVGVAFAITGQFQKNRDKDIQDRFSSLSFALEEAQKLYRSEVTEHDTTRRLKVAWKRLAMENGLSLDESLIAKSIAVAVAKAKAGETPGGPANVAE